MCLIAAFAGILHFRFLQHPQAQYSHGTEFAKSHVSPGYLMFIQVLASPPKTIGCLPGRNLGQAVGGGANRAPRTMGHRWLGLGNGPSYHATSQHLRFDVFFVWPCYVFFDTGKSCLQSSISFLKTRSDSDKITDPACRGRHHARDDARELRGNFGSKNIHVD